MAREFTFKKIPASPESATTIDYREQILMALRQPKSPGGVDYEEASQRLPLIRKVMDCEGDTIVLEEAEWTEICEAYKRSKFTGVLEGAVQLGDDLLNAPTVELAPVQKAGKRAH